MLQFIAGTCFGVTLSATVAVLLLSVPDKVETEEFTKTAAGGTPLKEKSLTPADVKILEAAIAELKGKQSAAVAASFDSRPSSPRKQTATAEEVTTHFSATLKESKVRIKDVKEFVAFFSELGKVFSVASQALGKLAERGLKHTDVQEEAKELGLDEDNQTLPAARWLSVGKYINTLAQDQESLAMLINSGIVVHASRHLEEMSLIDKRLSAEGAALVAKKKELAALFEQRLKARDRLNNEISEENLREANARLGEAEKDILTLLPRVDHDLTVSVCLKSSEDLRLMLLQFGRKMENVVQQAGRNVLRFQALFSAMATGREYEEDLLTHLLYMRNDHGEGGEAGSKLDMRADSTASLAAGAPSHLPRLPSFFAAAVAPESCIWFNAITGRMWRDIARSAYFQHWVCSRVSHAIARGKPAFIDALEVTSVEFGSIPPLFSNVRWIPASSHTEQGELDAEADFNVSVAADVTFRSGIKFTVQAKVWLNKAVAVFINVKLELELLQLEGSLVFGCQRDASYISFVETPYTSFSVNSEIGSKFKLRDLPHLSEYIIKKLRSSLKSNLVAPGRHLFRLIWPRTWWPEGTEHLFPPLHPPPDFPGPASAQGQGQDQGQGQGQEAGKEGEEQEASAAGEGRASPPPQQSAARTRLARQINRWIGRSACEGEGEGGSGGGGGGSSGIVGSSLSSTTISSTTSTTTVSSPSSSSASATSSSSSSSVAGLKQWIGQKTSTFSSFSLSRLRGAAKREEGDGGEAGGEEDEEGEEGAEGEQGGRQDNSLDAPHE